MVLPQTETIPISTMQSLKSYNIHINICKSDIKHRPTGVNSIPFTRCSIIFNIPMTEEKQIMKSIKKLFSYKQWKCLLFTF